MITFMYKVVIVWAFLLSALMLQNICDQAREHQYSVDVHIECLKISEYSSVYCPFPKSVQ